MGACTRRKSMSNKVIDTVSEMVQPILDNLQLELVDIEFVKEGQSWFLRVFIDSDDGVDIEECAKVSEALSEKLDEADPIKQNYFLEVSSPGAERPLKKEADFMKALGKNVYIKTYEPIEGNKEFEGELSAFDGENVEVTVMIKTRRKTINIPYDKVAKARLAVSFN
ncbi:ribosome maturation protein RimP [Bacillus licheniformis CG-B52]|nr:ribosome maturation factor RimP [Bacillus licheniformis DSM 13 = ATCC 14580]EQM28207.1 ribosome maturation protein RimP [Bacillus licheniformis CG-B52]